MENTGSTDTEKLFEILSNPLSGLARIAAEAEHSGDGHLVEFKSLKVRSLLNKSVSKRQLSLAYSINPYRGCEFGCKYCYARYTHEFLAPAADSQESVGKERAQDSAVGTAPGDLGGPANLRDPEAFERKIFIKENAAWLLEQELKKIDPEKEIALGTATDPYQPIERKALVTRSILEVFARRSGYRLGIITKSRLIERDIDLLREIARKNTLVVHLTITTTDAELARKLEPRAPRPDLRFTAVKKLREAGITVGILCSPLLPGITDSPEALEQMARQAAAVGASFFAAQPLFLKSCSRPTYLDFIREQFPALESDYARRFADRDFADAPYRQYLAGMVTEACRRHGLNERSSDALLTRDVGHLKKPIANVGARYQGLLFA
jgi:DNA repair photolyase